MIQKEFAKIFEMSAAQRLLLVEDIWDSIAESPDGVPLTDSQRKELDKRLNAYYENPDEA